jgi:CheY-like chemotaxis protein
MTTERLRLLLVAADETEVATVQRALRSLGYPLYVVPSGDEALAALRSGQVPRERLLVLVSLDATAALQTLRALRADPELGLLPVVLLTPAVDPSTKLLAYQLHAAGYLRTPTDPIEREEQLAALCNYWAANEMP